MFSTSSIADISSIVALTRVGVALAVGLTIGLERGWKEREAPEGSRVAGWRTFGLIGFAGGLWALLANGSALVLALALLAVVAILTAADRRKAAANADRSATTLIAAVVTFTLGGLAGGGRLVEAAAAAVTVSLLLSAKSTLHGWLRRFSEAELKAFLRFLLISVVILPLLPDRGLGPFGVLNPRQLWLTVVVVAGVSFGGYVAIRIWGQRTGAILTALLGGIVSSTAIALDFARRSKTPIVSPKILAAGVMLATAVSFARTLALVALFKTGFLPEVAVPIATMAIVSLVTAWLLWRRTADQQSTTQAASVRNPLELRSAVQLGILLAAMLVLSEWLRPRVGTIGIGALIALGGTIDVDAATISVCKMVGTDLAEHSAAVILFLSLVGNGLLKIAVVCLFGARALWTRTLLGYAATILAGASALALS